MNEKQKASGTKKVTFALANSCFKVTVKKVPKFCVMEICQCEDYLKHLENVKIYSFGTYHYTHQSLSGDKANKVYNKYFFERMYQKALTLSSRRRVYKMGFYVTGTNGISPKAPFIEHKAGALKPNTDNLIVHTKWMPVLPEVISQRIVNESKMKGAPY